MYKTIIEVKKDISSELRKWIKEQCNSAFNNRAGKAEDKSTNESVLIYEGKNDLYACLELGMFAVKENKKVMECIQAWEWIEPDPDECCNMLEVFARNS